MANHRAQDRQIGHLPDLLTQEEAVRILRLDQLGLKEPRESLRYLRRTHQLGYVKVAGRVLFPREEIEAYLDRQRVRLPKQENTPNFP